MYCKKCGTYLEEDAQFCSKCGTRLQNQLKEQQEMKTVVDPLTSKTRKTRMILGGICLVLALVLVIQLLLNRISKPENAMNVTSEKAECIGYETPEKLMEAFTQAIADNQAELVLQMFADDLVIQNHKLHDQTTYWSVDMHLIPEGNPIYQDADRLRYRGEHASKIKTMCLSMVCPRNELMYGMTFEEDENEKEKQIDELLESFKLNDIKNFRMVRMDRMENDGNTGKSWERKCTAYGANDYSEYGVLYQYGGKTWAGKVTVIKYGDLWYLLDLSEFEDSDGNSKDGALLQSTEDEYKELLRKEAE